MEWGRQLRMVTSRPFTEDAFISCHNNVTSSRGRSQNKSLFFSRSQILIYTITRFSGSPHDLMAVHAQLRKTTFSTRCRHSFLQVTYPQEGPFAQERCASLSSTRRPFLQVKCTLLPIILGHFCIFNIDQLFSRSI